MNKLRALEYIVMQSLKEDKPITTDAMLLVDDIALGNRSKQEIDDLIKSRGKELIS